MKKTYHLLALTLATLSLAACTSSENQGEVTKSDSFVSQTTASSLTKSNEKKTGFSLKSFKLKDHYIYGSYEGEIKRIRVKVNNEEQQIIPASDQKVKYYAKDIIHSVDDEVIVEGLNHKNEVQFRKKLTVLDSDN